MPQHQAPRLSQEEKTLIDRIAENEADSLPTVMHISLLMGDYETCSYITAKHFSKLPQKIQDELRVAGLKTVSDIMFDLDQAIEAKGEATAAPQVPNAPASDSVH